MLNKSLQSRFM